MSARSPVRLLFVILAHDRPEDAAALARALTAAASDARAVIHLDANAAPSVLTALRAAVADSPRVTLVERRVRCFWGHYSLVEASLRGLEEARAAADREGRSFDYAVLLSGVCLPSRPVRQLERYLKENAGREFIEIGDETWPTAGLRAERWTLHFPLKPLRRKALERWLVTAQRALGVRRRFPAGLTPRLGSQWWALTWATCAAVLDYAAAHPRAMRFFRTVWIPDEMVFPTLVNRLVAPEAVAGFGLTHFQFTDRGKPVVYFDDHADYAPTVNRFFIRKVSPEAGALRARLLALAATPDDGAPLDAIGVERPDYEAKTRAQIRYPPPGAIFYRDQYLDTPTSVLSKARAPYVVVCGPGDLARATLASFEPPAFEPLGALFAPEAVDFGPGRASFRGLHAEDAPIRDLHPALYLARARARCAGAPVLTWSPGDALSGLWLCLEDPRALLVLCAPDDADPLVARRGFARGRAAGAPRPPMPGVDGRARDAAWAELDGGYPDGWAFDRLLEPDPATTARMIPLLWGADAAGRAQRGAAFEAALARSPFAGAPWFDALADALRAARATMIDPPERAAAAPRAAGGVGS